MRSIEKYQNRDGNVYVNCASSTRVIEGFVNLDNDALLHFGSWPARFKWLLPRQYWEAIDQWEIAKRRALLIRHDCRKRLMFHDAAVDHILCSHFLDYVFPDEMENILKDFFRVLKIGATLHIVLPDLRVMAERYLQRAENAEADAADWFLNITILGRQSRGSSIYRLIEYFGFCGLQHRWM